MMDTSTIGLLYGGVTLLLLFSGMPIAFALGLSALGFMAAFMPAPNLQSVAETIFSELDNFTLLTIPLFVLMGAAIGKTRPDHVCAEVGRVHLRQTAVALPDRRSDGVDDECFGHGASFACCESSMSWFNG
jgi:TRAP-type mannitol/chloroaromatic compound transport system permease large subunit